MNRAAVGSIELAYETFGDATDPPVVLIMGLATQMLGWHHDFCTDLASRGVYVVRFDNRDIGLSTHCHDAVAPDLAAALAGDLSTATYTLSDMAGDTVGLLDALGLDSAHLVGASMGGMIAQTVAIEHPDRVRSLTSIMSTTGAAAVGGPTAEAWAVLTAPPAQTRDEAVQRALIAYRVIGSPGFDLDEAWHAERAGESFDRAHDPAGVGRQLLAVIASGDRTSLLRRIAVPTLVIHGADDPLVDVSGGVATAAAIPGAESMIIDGMGHDLPRPLWTQILDRIVNLVERSDGTQADG